MITAMSVDLPGESTETKKCYARLLCFTATVHSVKLMGAALADALEGNIILL